jgi:hypothetical protein
MAGLFGLFSKKNNNPVQKEAYYLTPDESKTYGDIDYMRTSKTVRKTFAKSVSGGGGELIQEVSAMKAKKRSGNEAFNQINSSTSNSFSDTSNSFTNSNSTPSFSASSSRKTNTDTTMNMFRNMAKQIKKK